MVFPSCFPVCPGLADGGRKLECPERYRSRRGRLCRLHTERSALGLTSQLLESMLTQKRSQLIQNNPVTFVNPTCNITKVLITKVTHHKCIR